MKIHVILTKGEGIMSDVSDRMARDIASECRNSPTGIMQKVYATLKMDGLHGVSLPADWLKALVFVEGLEKEYSHTMESLRLFILAMEIWQRDIGRPRLEVVVANYHSGSASLDSVMEVQSALKVAENGLEILRQVLVNCQVVVNGLIDIKIMIAESQDMKAVWERRDRPLPGLKLSE